MPRTSNQELRFGHLDGLHVWPDFGPRGSRQRAATMLIMARVSLLAFSRACLTARRNVSRNNATDGIPNGMVVSFSTGEADSSWGDPPSYRPDRMPPRRAIPAQERTNPSIWPTNVDTNVTIIPPCAIARVFGGMDGKMGKEGRFGCPLPLRRISAAAMADLLNLEPSPCKATPCSSSLPPLLQNSAHATPPVSRAFWHLEGYFVGYCFHCGGLRAILKLDGEVIEFFVRGRPSAASGKPYGSGKAGCGVKTGRTSRAGHADPNNCPILVSGLGATS